MLNMEKFVVKVKLTAEETLLTGSAFLVLKQSGAFNHSPSADSVGQEIFERGKAIGIKLNPDGKNLDLRRARAEMLNLPDEVFSFTLEKLEKLIHVINMNVEILVAMNDSAIISGCGKLIARLAFDEPAPNMKPALA